MSADCEHTRLSSSLGRMNVIAIEYVKAFSHILRERRREKENSKNDVYIYICAEITISYAEIIFMTRENLSQGNIFKFIQRYFSQERACVCTHILLFANNRDF